MGRESKTPAQGESSSHMACAASCLPGRQVAWKKPWTGDGGVEMGAIVGAVVAAVGPGGGCHGCCLLEEKQQLC